MKRIAVIGGDGIGPEVVAAAQPVLAAAAPGALEFTGFDWGAERYLRDGVTLPRDGLATMRGFDAIFFGAVGDPRVPSNRHAAEILLGLRFGLDLYANVRPVRPLAARLCPLKDPNAVLDLVVVRENTEGPYVSMGGRFKPGTREEVATETDINTYRGVERVQRYAFEQARRRPRHRLHLADKANALVHAGALWRRVFAELQAEFPEVTASAMFVDAMALELVRKPAQFDVIVTNNLFGDILTDLAAALEGGLGLAASANLHPGGGAGGDVPGLFEPVHGSAPAMAGRDEANPVGSILSGALMLAELGLSAAAERIERAVAATIAAGEGTRDMGGELGTQATAAAILRRLSSS